MAFFSWKRLRSFASLNAPPDGLASRIGVPQANPPSPLPMPQPPIEVGAALSANLPSEADPSLPREPQPEVGLTLSGNLPSEADPSLPQEPQPEVGLTSSRISPCEADHESSGDPPSEADNSRQAEVVVPKTTPQQRKAWKDAGRPPCPVCTKMHPPPHVDGVPPRKSRQLTDAAQADQALVDKRIDTSTRALKPTAESSKKRSADRMNAAAIYAPTILCRECGNRHSPGCSWPPCKKVPSCGLKHAYKMPCHIARFNLREKLTAADLEAIHGTGDAATFNAMAPSNQAERYVPGQSVPPSRNAWAASQQPAPQHFAPQQMAAPTFAPHEYVQPTFVPTPFVPPQFIVHQHAPPPFTPAMTPFETMLEHSAKIESEFWQQRFRQLAAQNVAQAIPTPSLQLTSAPPTHAPAPGQTSRPEWQGQQRQKRQRQNPTPAEEPTPAEGAVPPQNTAGR